MAWKKVRVVLMVAMAISLVSIASATEFVVGDGKGWTLGEDYTAWAKGKVFKVGDTLVFKYKAPNHDVIKVDATNFDECTAPAGTEPLATGNDVIPLTSPGEKWYICGQSSHCDSGMKLTINVAPNSEAPNVSPAPDVYPDSPANSARRIAAASQCQNLMAVIATVAMTLSDLKFISVGC